MFNLASDYIKYELDETKKLFNEYWNSINLPPFKIKE